MHFGRGNHIRLLEEQGQTNNFDSLPDSWTQRHEDRETRRLKYGVSVGGSGRIRMWGDPSVSRLCQILSLVAKGKPKVEKNMRQRHI